MAADGGDVLSWVVLSAKEDAKATKEALHAAGRLETRVRVVEFDSIAAEIALPVHAEAVDALREEGFTLRRARTVRKGTRQQPRPPPHEAQSPSAQPPGPTLDPHVARARYRGWHGWAPQGRVPTLDCAGLSPEQAAAAFRRVYDGERHPVVLRGLDVGPCVRTWTPAYLRGAEGPERVLTAGVHVCATECIDLAGHRRPNTPKNFRFVEMGWAEMIARAAMASTPPADTDAPAPLAPIVGPGERLYMRSVAEGRAGRREPSHLRSLFPRLAADVRLPEGVMYPPHAYHSSVLRVASAGTQLWTHYDVMDNALVQAVGRKRVVLWPPAEAGRLYTDHSSSRVDDIDAPDLRAFPRFARAERTRAECTLAPGDVLFIPALWFHHVTSLDFSVAVNVFWRALDESEYAKDLYGNKELRAAERAVRAAEKAAAALVHLPDPYRSFYARRAARALEVAAASAGSGASTNGSGSQPSGFPASDPMPPHAVTAAEPPAACGVDPMAGSAALLRPTGDGDHGHGPGSDNRGSDTMTSSCSSDDEEQS